MKKLLLAGALALGSWAGAAQAVTTVTFNGGSGTLPSDTRVFQSYDGLASGSAIGTNAFVYDNSVARAARPAYGSTGNFAAVLSGGTYSVNFTPTNVFSFVLGSLDTFNSLTLRYTDGTSFTYTGGAIVNDPSFDSGNRTSAETNGVVTYRVTSGALISGATFTASGDSFEFDNLASAVPEPAAWGMMIFGFGLVGGVLRRRPSVGVKFA